MRKGRFLLVFMLLALMVSLGPGVMLAQEPLSPEKRIADGVQPTW